jgi:hypothetical protein
VAQVLQQLKDSYALTLGEGKGFCEQGGMIEFVKGETIGFEVNQVAAEQRKLRISPQLLKRARKVWDKSTLKR